MTKTFKITSTAGVDLGTYKAADEAAALDAMARDAGYADYAEAQATASSLDDLIVEEVETEQRSYADLHKDLTEWLAGVLKPDADAERYATALIEESEPRDGEIHVEVRGLHSRTGNPVTARFDYFDEEDGYGWRAFEAYNTAAIYGYGTPDEASAYQDHLNAGREINHFAARYVTLAEARELGLWDRTDTLNLADALTDID